MSEYAIGVTTPPFHQWCRGTTAPYFDDMDDIAERWARDPETGETYTVPGNMTYKQWAAKQTGLAKSVKPLEKSTKSGIIKTVNIGRSVGASAKNYPVKLVESKQHVKLAEGQQIKGKVFAGKGTKVAIKDRFRLEADYKIAADKWQKVSGNAYIILKGKKQKAELHWYEADGEIFEMKAKRYIDES